VESNVLQQHFSDLSTRKNSKADSKLDFNCRKRRSVPAGTLWKTQSADVRYGRSMSAMQTCFPLYIPKNGLLRRLAANIVIRMSSLYHSLQTWFGFLASFGQRHFGLQLRWRHSNTQEGLLASLPTH
jgi:hypothetical protein